MDRHRRDVSVPSLVALACVTSVCALAGEHAAQDRVLAFDVVSVKPNVSGATNSTSIVQPGARYTATNATLRTLIKTAYQVHDDQIVYALTVVRRDRFGPQLRRSGMNCAGPGTPLPVAPDASEPVPELTCGAGFSRAGHLGGRAREFSTLFRSLFSWTDRVLIDRTELIGTFDWDLQWTPESSSPEVASVPSRLPLVTALREQLGLRLEPQRSPLEVLVIDRAERPQPD